MTPTEIRLIIQSSDDLEKEFITFTDEFDAPIEEMTVPGLTVRYDKVVTLAYVEFGVMHRIDEFPFNSDFEKRW